MQVDLLESQRRRERSGGSTFTSVLLHTTVIGLALLATAGAKQTKSVPKTVEKVYWTPVQPHGGPKAPVCECSVPLEPVLGPITVPTLVPVIGPLAPVIEQPPFPGGAIGPATQSPESGNPEPETVVEVADQPARALELAHPTYPSLLRTMHVQGDVSARYIVDTTGRVEPESISFVGSSEKLFEESVRRALLASRFVPARTHDRAVRMLVRQDFAFRLTP